MREQRDNILTDVYEDWLTNGVFKQLEAFDVPWKTYVSGEVLDLDYYGNHSGSKLVSPLIHKLLTDTGLSTANQAKLASLIWYKYGMSWNRAWQALITEYDPLENYHKTEVREPNLTDERTDDLEYKRTADITDTRTANLTNTRTDNLTGTRTDNLTEKSTPAVKDTEITKTKNKQTTENAVYGFNSSQAVPSDTSETSGQKTDNETERTLEHTGFDTIDNTGTQTQVNTGTQTNAETGTDTNKKTGTDTYANTGTQTTTHTGDETTETYGNIGVITNQQMLEAELELRFKWNFFESVFRDVDEILTVNVFGHPIDHFIYN